MCKEYIKYGRLIRMNIVIKEMLTVSYSSRYEYGVFTRIHALTHDLYIEDIKKGLNNAFIERVNTLKVLDYDRT